jgi:hypothetical protein
MNNYMNIQLNSKYFLVMSIGSRRSCSMKIPGKENLMALPLTAAAA